MEPLNPRALYSEPEYFDYQEMEAVHFLEYILFIPVNFI